MKNLSSCFLLLAIGFIAQDTSGQNIGDFFIDYGGDCLKEGAAWFLTSPCKSYSGTVECFGEDLSDPNNPIMGKCECNLRGSAYFDADNQVCVGKVGAFCNAEKTSLVPGKSCTNFSECVARDGYTVGTCQCLYGYKSTTEGRCEVDDTIGDDERSTPRTTTTTPAPDKGNVKLPPLSVIADLLVGKIVGLGHKCSKGDFLPLLNRTHCQLHKMTVACVNQVCGCNMGSEDAIFDSQKQQCVSRVGAYCLSRKNILGEKACTEGADCIIENGMSADHSFGTCQCKYGYSEKPDGTCVYDPSETTTAATTLPPGTDETEGTEGTGETEGTGSTNPGGTESTTEGSAGKIRATVGVTILLSFIYVLILPLMTN